MTKRERFLVGITLFMAVFAAASLYASIPVRAVRVTAGSVGGTIVAEARVEPVGGVSELRARTDGRVLHVRVREGDRVKAGELLAEIEADELGLLTETARSDQRAIEARAQAVSRGSRHEMVNRSAAELAAAEAALALASDRAERAETLHRNGAYADNALFEAQQNLALARASAEQAQAQHQLVVSGSRGEEIAEVRQLASVARKRVEQAELRLSWSRVVSPIDGVIVARHVDDGDTVFTTPVATLLFEIADPARTELMVEVDESSVGAIEPELQVTVTRPGGRVEVASGLIDRVSARMRERSIDAARARVRAETSVRPVWVRWNDARGPELAIGMRVEAIIRLKPKQVRTRVPRAALVVEDGAINVRARGRFFSDLVRVDLGATDDQYVEVFGIEPDREVLVTPMPKGFGSVGVELGPNRVQADAH